MIERSATGALTVRDAVEESFEGSGSVGSPCTLAVFESDPATNGDTTIVIVADAPDASEPRSHVTVPASSTQVPCEASAEPNTTEPGSGSVATTPEAAEGPAFPTSSV